VTERPSRLPVALSIATIVAVVAAVIAISVLYGGGGNVVDGVAAPAPGQPTTSGQPAPTTTTTGAAPTTTGAPAPDSVEIANPDARLTYRVPRTWVPDPAARPEVLGVEFAGAATFAQYECGGQRYSRAFAVSAAVQSTGEEDLDPKATAEKFAAEFGARYFPGGEAGEPRAGEAEVAGREAVLVAAPITVTGQDPECVAAAGIVSVLAVDLDNGSGSGSGKRGVALLVIVADARGGPTEPAPPSQQDLREVIAGVRIT
jgi:hypothetical protein